MDIEPSFEKTKRKTSVWKILLDFSLASRAKTVDNQAARQKGLIFTKTIKKRREINTLPDLCLCVHFWKNELQGKLEKHQIRTGLFQFGFLLKSQNIYHSAPSSLFFFTYFCSKILQFKLLMKICFQINFWGFFQHIVLEVNLRINWLTETVF